MKTANFERITNELKASANGWMNGKITIICMNDWGAVCVMRGTVQKAELSPYAQYKNALHITFIPERKRTARIAIFTETQDFAIFYDWETPKEQMPDSFWGFDKEIFYKIVDSVNGDKIGENSERVYMHHLQNVQKVYRVIKGFGADNVEEYESEAELLKKYEKTGVLCDTVRRFELQNTPKLKGLCGAMFDGYENGKAVIRYETQAVYNVLSN